MAAANKGNKPRVRSIRFAAGHDAEGSHSHVHFDEKLHDSVVMVTQESDSSFLVKVGFLKILHRYEITFTLPPVHRLSKDVREAPVPSLHLKLLSVVPVPEGLYLLPSDLLKAYPALPPSLLITASPCLPFGRKQPDLLLEA
ncbi:adipose-secreted signaling protein isoform X2 [Gorilla gorilla gorilla]|uniref:adipose-secreted signaling protein isoform X2 n=1 Tax=Gorilla gorilla gorilla TaxID=9595 RepID=UPI00300B75A3